MKKDEYETIRSVLAAITFPEGVVDWELELGEDWVGDPAAFVSIVVDDAVWDEAWIDAHSMPIRNAIYDAFAAAEIEHWPFVRFMLTSDRQPKKQRDRRR